MKLFEFLEKIGNNKYIVKSEKGKNMSKPLSKKKAKKRLQQIEYFNHLP